MKILHILPELNIGGVERHVIDLATEQTRLGHQTCVVSAGGRMEHQLPETIEKFHLPVHRKNPLTALWCAWRLACKVRTEKWQIIHAHSRVPAWIAWIASCLSGMPFVVTAHSLYSKNAGLWPFRKARGAICISDAVQKWLQDRLPALKEVIYNGIELHKGQWQPRDDKVVQLLVVGRLTRIKGLESLFEALGKVEQTNWHLRIVGEGPLEEELQKLADRLNIASQITFAGYCENVIDDLLQCHCYLLPSLSEGMGLSLMQAAALGVPVVVSRLPAIRELTLDDTGLVPAGDVQAWQEALSHLLKGQWTFPRFDKTKLLSLGEMTDKTVAFYRKASSTEGSRRSKREVAMRVLHHVDERYLAWVEPWMQLLSAMAEQGVENHVVCKEGGSLASRLREAGFAVTTCTPLAQWLPPLCRPLGAVIDRFKPQVIHTRLSSAARISGWWGVRKGIPVLATVDKYPKAKYYRQAQLLAGCSTSVSEYMMSLGFPQAQVVTVLNPIDTSRYVAPEGAREAMRQSLGVTDDEIMVLGMGRFVEWKSWDVYIKAIAALPESLPFRFFLVGDGEERRSLVQLTKALNLSRRLTINPFVADVRPWLWAADLFVHPSREEAFGIMMLEALAAGLPCVAAETGGAQELIEQGVNGFMVPLCTPEALAEALCQLKDRSKRKAMSQQAVCRASLFDVKLIAQQYVSLYQRVARNSEKSREA